MQPPSARPLSAQALSVTADDGTALTCWDFGGDGIAVLAVHGTGLHGRCWAPVAAGLPAGARLLALDLRGHGASGSSPDGNYEWERFGADVLCVVDQLGLAPGRGLVGAGHSAGGATLVLAEGARPGTFDRLWAWEPIVSVPGSDLRDRRSTELAQRARRRRRDFASTEEARSHLQGRGLFAEFAPEALDAYLAGGLVPRPAGDGGGVTLACSPEVEARVYEAAPRHRAWDLLPAVSCPARLLGGGRSPAVPPADLEAIAHRWAGAEGALVEVWAGMGHFGPFEGPGRVAADIAAWATGA